MKMKIKIHCRQREIRRIRLQLQDRPQLADRHLPLWFPLTCLINVYFRWRNMLICCGEYFLKNSLNSGSIFCCIWQLANSLGIDSQKNRSYCIRSNPTVKTKSTDLRTTIDLKFLWHSTVISKLVPLHFRYRFFFLLKVFRLDPPYYCHHTEIRFKWAIISQVICVGI